MITLSYVPSPIVLEFPGAGGDYIFSMRINRMTLDDNHRMTVYLNGNQRGRYDDMFPINPPPGEPFSMTYDSLGKLTVGGVTVWREWEEDTLPDVTTDTLLHVGKTTAFSDGGETKHIHNWKLQALAGRQVTQLTIDGNEPSQEAKDSLSLGDYDGDADADVYDVELESGEYGYDHALRLFGNQVRAHSLSIHYLEDYGALCNVSFLASRVLIKGSMKIDETVHPPEESIHIVRGFIHMGERLPEFYDQNTRDL
jgi:hypothetical protein